LKEDKNGFVDKEVERTREFLDGDTIVVDVVVGSTGERTYLQLCEWHVIEAIKKRLVHSGRYSKDTQEVLVNLLNQ
jgi:glyceraldehyde-3-phosphate dehydrogenase/erythrose-4-phosphate dehydrogenase